MPQVNAHWQLPFIWSHVHVAFELSSNNLACRCSTILVRNRDRELYCVGCEAFVRTAPEPTALPAAEDPTAATMDHAQRHPAAEPIDQAQPQQQQLQQERQRGMLQGQDLQQRQEKVAAQVCNTLLDKVLELEQRISQVHGEGCEHLLSQLRSTLKTYQLLQDSFMRRRA